MKKQMIVFCVLVGWAMNACASQHDIDIAKENVRNKYNAFLESKTQEDKVTAASDIVSCPHVKDEVRKGFQEWIDKQKPVTGIKSGIIEPFEDGPYGKHFKDIIEKVLKANVIDFLFEYHAANERRSSVNSSRIPHTLIAYVNKSIAVHVALIGIFGYAMYKWGASRTSCNENNEQKTA